MNVIESAYTFGQEETIGLAELPLAITNRSTCSASPTSPLSSLAPFAEVERELIARALEATGGNKLRAAQLLGISRKKLYARIGKYDLEFVAARRK
jgi:DNA-binding NtrC family response regulator